MTRPTPQLSALREIGWSIWDPIGLADVRRDCIDEYDQYVLHVAGLLMRGGSEAEAGAYLEYIEMEHMGLGASDTTRVRAGETVAAIGQYLSSPRP